MRLATGKWMLLPLLFGVLYGTRGAVAQTDSPRLIPRTPEQQRAQYEANRRITLAAVVTNASGAPVTGLKQNDFTIVENGVVRPIVSFAEISKGELAQVHGLLVVDGINSSGSALRKERKAIKDFLSHAQTLPMPVAIVAVTDGGVSEGSATTDAGALMRDLDVRTADLQGQDCGGTQPGSDLGSRMGGGLSNAAQNTPGGAGGDCRLEQFNQSMNALHELFGKETKAEGRAIVIWLGSGWPIPPEVHSGQIMGSLHGGRAADMVTTLSNDMVAGQVEFDAVSWGQFATTKGVRRVNAAANIDAASQTEQETMLTIPALAEESGGLTFARTKNIAEAIGQLLNEGASFYKIAFDPVAATKADEFRTVEVKVASPGATVRTVHTYFEQP